MNPDRGFLPERKAEFIHVTWINQSGAGYSEEVRIRRGTTLSSFINDRVQGAPTNYVITVNLERQTPSYICQDGDKISATTEKPEAGRL